MALIPITVTHYFTNYDPLQELEDGLVWVAEQIPGLTLAKDVTQTLERGYWPSYNVPYFREVRHAARLCALAVSARSFSQPVTCSFSCGAQIYDQAGYQGFRDAHTARGPEFAAALTGLSYQLVRHCARLRFVLHAWDSRCFIHTACVSARQ